MMRSRSRRSRIRKISSAILLLFLVAVFVPDQVTAQSAARSKRELERRKKRINDEIRQINAQLNQTKASKKSSMGALVALNVKLRKRQELISAINQEIGLLDREIGNNQRAVSQLQTSLQKLKGEYAKMILYAQRNQDAYNTLMFIFAAENFNQAYARMKYIQQYSEFRRRQALQIINTQTELLGKLKELKTQQTEKMSLLDVEQKQQQTISQEKQQQEKTLTELQKKEKQLRTELEKKKADAAAMQLAIKKIIEEEIRRKAEEARKREEAKRIAAEKERLARQKSEKTKPGKKVPDAREKKEERKERLVPELSDEAIALSADFSNNRGKLPWPVTKGVICEQYGQHEHPAIKGFIMFNNGIEICCTKGTEARAVFDGEVTGIALSPAGGKLVIIRHGEYLSVYSNLDQVNVKTGQKVSVKQIIGTVMHDEDNGVSQIGFQIWKEQKTMDPGGWLVNGR